MLLSRHPLLSNLLQSYRRMYVNVKMSATIAINSVPVAIKATPDAIISTPLATKSTPVDTKSTKEKEDKTDTNDVVKETEPVITKAKECETDNEIESITKSPAFTSAFKSDAPEIKTKSITTQNNPINSQSIRTTEVNVKEWSTEESLKGVSTKSNTVMKEAKGDKENTHGKAVIEPPPVISDAGTTLQEEDQEAPDTANYNQT